MKRAEQEFGKKTSVAFVSQIMGQIFNMLFVVIVGRLLGADIYGEVLFVFTMLNFCIAFTKFGLVNSLVAFIARENITIEQKRWIVQRALFIASSLSIICMCILFMGRSYIDVFSGDTVLTDGLFVMMLPFILCQTLIEVTSAVMRGSKDIRRHYMGSVVLGNFLRMVGVPIIFFLFNIRSVFCLVLTYYISYILNLIYCIHYLCQKKLLFGNTQVFSWKELLGQSFPMLFTGMVVILNREIDTYMVGYFMASANVAIYGLAVNMGNFSHFGLNAVNSIFAPLISELYHADKKDELKSIYSRGTKWITVLNVLILGMVLVFADDIMRIAGDEFAVGGIVLIVVMFGQLVNSGVGSVGFLNSMTGHPKCNLVATTTALIANVLLNFLLIRDYGMIGVGVASAASVAINNIVNFVFMYRNLHMHPYNKKYIGIFATLLLTVPVLYGLRMLLDINYFIRLIICGIIYVIIFAVGIYVLVCDKDEQDMIKKLFARICKKSKVANR